MIMGDEPPQQKDLVQEHEERLLEDFPDDVSSEIVDLKGMVQELFGFSMEHDKKMKEIQGKVDQLSRYCRSFMVYRIDSLREVNAAQDEKIKSLEEKIKELVASQVGAGGGKRRKSKRRKSKRR